MPLVLPPYVPYQGTPVQTPGTWNRKPREGDKQIQMEFDWSTQGGPNNCIYNNLSSGNVVPISQIAALAVDNSHCGVDVLFLFPDTGFKLNVPAFGGGVFQVFTNATAFYALAQGAGGNDNTVVMVLNSLPPPISIQPTEEQTIASVSGVSLTANATTTLVAAGVNGAIEAFDIGCAVDTGGAGEIAVLSLVDGSTPPVTLWQTPLSLPASTFQTIRFTLSGIRARFFNGLSIKVASTSIATGNASVNIYYGTP